MLRFLALSVGRRYVMVQERRSKRISFLACDARMGNARAPFFSISFSRKKRKSSCYWGTNVLKFIVHLCDIGYLRTYFTNRKLFHLKHFHGFEINRARLVQFDVEKGVKNLISKAWASSQTFSLYSDRQ